MKQSREIGREFLVSLGCSIGGLQESQAVVMQKKILEG